MGRSVPPEETVCAGCEGQLTGPGVAHQATAAHCQCQHPCQPQVSKAGVYELWQKKNVLLLLVFTIIGLLKISLKSGSYSVHVFHWHNETRLWQLNFKI